MLFLTVGSLLAKLQEAKFTDRLVADEMTS